MTQKKSFLTDPATAFLPKSGEPKEATAPRVLPNIHVKEKKSARLNLVIAPSVKQRITEEATRIGISTNDLISQLIENFLEDLT